MFTSSDKEVRIMVTRIFAPFECALPDGDTSSKFWKGSGRNRSGTAAKLPELRTQGVVVIAMQIYIA